MSAEVRPAWDTILGPNLLLGKADAPANTLVSLHKANTTIINSQKEAGAVNTMVNT